MTLTEVMEGVGLFKTLNQLHGDVAYEPSHMEVAFKPSQTKPTKHEHEQTLDESS